MQEIVQILNNNTTIGTGFLVSEKYVITCSHVIAKLDGFTIEDYSKIEININFPFCDNKLVVGNIVKYFPEKDNAVFSDIEDITLIELQTPISITTKPIVDPHINEKLIVYGFGTELGKWIGITVKGKMKNGWVQLEAEKEVAKGYSGAPIYSSDRTYIVGMMTATLSGTNEAYFIPSCKIFQGLHHYISKQFSDSKFYEYLIDFLHSYQKIILANDSFFQLINPKSHDKRFYKFTKPKWSDILLDFDIKRDIQDSILESILFCKDYQLFLIKSPSGEGKSTLLKRLVLDVYKRQRLCYFIDAENTDLNEIEKLLQSKEFLYRESILFIDNGFRNDILFKILDHYDFLHKIKIVCTVQSREYTQKEALLFAEYIEPKIFELTTLSIEEKESIINKLKIMDFKYNENINLNQKEWLSEFISKLIPENNFQAYTNILIEKLTEYSNKSNLLLNHRHILIDTIKYTSLFNSYGFNLDVNILIRVLQYRYKEAIEYADLIKFVLTTLEDEIILDENGLSYRHELFAVNVKNYFFNDNELNTVNYLSEIDDISLVPLKELYIKFLELQDVSSYNEPKISKEILNSLNLYDYKIYCKYKSNLNITDYHIFIDKINSLKLNKNPISYEFCTKNYIFNKIYLNYLKQNYPLHDALNLYIVKLVLPLIDRKTTYNDLEDKNLVMKTYEQDLRDLSINPKSNSIVSMISLSYYLGKDKRANFVLKHTNFKSEKYLFHLMKYYVAEEKFQKVIDVGNENELHLQYKDNKYLYARSILKVKDFILEGLSEGQRKSLQYELEYLSGNCQFKINNIQSLFWFLASKSLLKKKQFNDFFQQNHSFLSLITYKVFQKKYDNLFKKQLEFSIPAIYYIIENINKNIGTLYKAFYLIKLQKEILKIIFYPKNKLTILLRETIENYISFANKIAYNDFRRMNSFLIIALHYQDFISDQVIKNVINKFLLNCEKTDDNASLYYDFLYYISLLYKDYQSAERYLTANETSDSYYIRKGDYYFYYKKSYHDASIYYLKSYKLSRNSSDLLKAINAFKENQLFNEKYKNLLDLMLSMESYNYLVKEYLKEYEDFINIRDRR